MHESADAGDDIRFMRLDREFNVLVSQATRNEFASEAISLMAGLSRRFWFMHYRQAGDLTMISRLHADIANAVAAADEAAAAAASDLLLDYIEHDHPGRGGLVSRADAVSRRARSGRSPGACA